MALGTYRLVVNKTLLLVLVRYGLFIPCFMTGCTGFTSGYVFQPSVILQVVDQSCFVGVSMHGVQSDDTEFRKLYEGLQKTFNDEVMVVIGLVDIRNFKWPSGNALRIKDDLDEPEILIFPKKVHDRTCLSTGNMPVKEPLAHGYNSIRTDDILVEFINQQCNTYRASHGGLSIEGLHRRDILSSLFHAQNVSNINMGNLAGIFEQSFCSKDSCEEHKTNENNNNVNDLHTFPSRSVPNTINFRNSELNIEKCEEMNLPSREEFFHKFLKISKPVVFKNAIHHWKAMTKWTNQYFRSNYGDRTVHIKLTPQGEFEGVDSASNFENFKDFKIPPDVRKQLLFPDLVVVRPATANMNFSTFLDVVESVANSSRTGLSAYLEYSSIADIVPELEEDISELPIMENLLHLLHQNIWLSDGNTLGKLHFDPFDNLLCQVSGRKQVILFDPHDNSKLYEAHIPEASLSYNSTSKTFHKKQLTDSTSMVMSPVDITNPDFERFPLFSQAHPLNCTIDEGDVLFMPAFWWHEVQSYPNVKQGRNLAVNFWYEPFLEKEFPCQECRLDVNPAYRHLL